jgi:hypothetical protein
VHDFRVALATDPQVIPRACVPVYVGTLIGLTDRRNDNIIDGVFTSSASQMVRTIPFDRAR